MRHCSRKLHYPLWLGVALAFSPFALATLPPTLAISTIPLISVQYGAPQVLFVLDNSQSMDGDLAGAIMTGSGTATDSANKPVDLQSSSPADYTVPAGFTAPVSGATSGATPYTVNGTDNSASRLNVAKEAIQQAYNQWNGMMNFGLMDYGVKGTPKKSTTYTTWVYYMSGPGGFAFGTSPTAPTQTAGGLTVPLQSVPNPCYYANTQATKSCVGIHAYFTSINVSGSFSDPWLYIQDTSDAPDINDVLYGGGLPSNFITYAGPHPTSPYTGYTLQNYNNGTISESYDRSTIPGPFGTSPTNAGYVPYSPQVWYSERGFGYDYNITNTGKLVIPVATANTASSQFTADLADLREKKGDVGLYPPGYRPGGEALQKPQKGRARKTCRSPSRGRRSCPCRPTRPENGTPVSCRLREERGVRVKNLTGAGRSTDKAFSMNDNFECVDLVDLSGSTHKIVSNKNKIHLLTLLTSRVRVPLGHLYLYLKNRTSRI